MAEAPLGSLVIGVGSEIRRDDAVGRVVAERVEQKRWPGVSVRVVTQLVPELVEAMAAVNLAVIVDADVSGTEPVVREVIEPGPSSLTHQASPEGLVALARLTGSHVPGVLVVGVPPSDLGLGTGLSPACEARVEPTVALIERLVRSS